MGLAPQCPNDTDTIVAFPSQIVKEALLVRIAIKHQVRKMHMSYSLPMKPTRGNKPSGRMVHSGSQDSKKQRWACCEVNQ